MGIVYESRTAELPPAFSYRLLRSDHGLAHVATRYGATLEEVLRESVRWNRTWGSYGLASPEHFAHHVHAADPSHGPPWAENTIVMLPTPDAERTWEWKIFIVQGSATLQEVCDAQNKDRERVEGHMPTLEPIDLWHFSVNCWLRNTVLKTQPQDKHADIDRDPSAVALPDGAHVWVPYPRHLTGGVIHAAPNPVAAPAGAAGVRPNTVSVRPVPDTILKILREHLAPIDAVATRLARSNAQSKAASEKGGAILVQLSLLRQILARYELEHVHRSHILDDTKLSVLEDALNDVQLAATNVLANPYDYADHADEVRRHRLAGRLDFLLHEPAFTSLCMDLVGEPDIVLNGVSLVTYICDRVATAYGVLGQTSKIDERMAQIDAALARFASGAGVDPASSSPLHALLSAAGTAASTTTSIVGFGALVTKALELSLVKALARGLSSSPADRGVIIDRLTSVLLKLGGLQRGELAAAVALAKGSSAHALRAQLRTLSHKVTANVRATRAAASFSSWGWVDLALNVIALLSTVETEDRITAHYWTKVLGGSVSTATAALQLVRELAPTGARFQSVASTVSKGLGTFGAVLSVVSGCFTAYEGITDHNDSVVAGGALVAAGSLITAAAFAIPLWGQVLGVAMVLTGSQLGGSTPLEDYFTQESTQLFGRAMLVLGAHPLHDTPNMTKWDAEMRSRFDTLRSKFADFQEAARKAQLGNFADTTDNETFLLSLGFDPDQAAQLRGLRYAGEDPNDGRMSVSRMD